MAVTPQTTAPRELYPDYIAYTGADALTLKDDWGTTFFLDAIDSFSAKPGANDAQVQFGALQPNGGIRFRQPITLPVGIWSGPTQDDFHNFQAMQFRNAAPSANATLEVIAVCKGNR